MVASDGATAMGLLLEVGARRAMNGAVTIAGPKKLAEEYHSWLQGDGGPAYMETVPDTMQRVMADDD